MCKEFCKIFHMVFQGSITSVMDYQHPVFLPQQKKLRIAKEIAIIGLSLIHI